LCATSATSCSCGVTVTSSPPDTGGMLMASISCNLLL
jgi:hypothetical protein